MEAALATVLAEAAKQCDIEVQVHNDYSGRGMMGRSTIGLSYENKTDLMRMVAQAAFNIADTEDGPDAYGLTRDEFLESLDFRTDSMGRGTILY